MNSPLTTEKKCVLHASSSCRSFYQELHHPVVQAWQRQWQPEFVSGTDLWHRVTFPCCPTGHRNVHYILVRMMKRWEQWTGGNPDPGIVFQTSAGINQNAILCRREMRSEGAIVNDKEWRMAASSMALWDETGGDLMHMCAKRLYGYA